MARGIAAERIVFAQHVPLPEHLARHEHADLFLDTMPHSAGTTANDALLMGVPVLTCAGETMASRAAASQLHAIGLPELVADNPDEYEARALALAQDAGALKGMSERLAANRGTTALFDMARFTKNLESRALVDRRVMTKRSTMKPPASRNAPCPCGSGRRYKECHGALGAEGLSLAAQSDSRELIAQALQAIARSDLASAERGARAVEAADRRHPDAAHVLALVALARGQFADAVTLCDRAIAVLPDHAAFHATRARALLAMQRPAEAEKSARRRSRSCPTTQPVVAAGPCARSTRTGFARRPPESSTTTDSAAAEEAWRSALAIDPSNAEALFYLGNAARDRGDASEAIRLYEDALRHHPRDAQLMNNLGLALEQSGDIDAARKRYEDALAATDPPPEAHANLARLLERRQDFPGAAAHYQAYATSVTETPAYIWSSLAQCQHRLGALHAAEESYRKALTLAPDSADIQYGLAALLVELGRSAEATPLLAALSKTNPSGRVLHALLFARLLVCDWTDFDAALAELRTYISRFADHPADTLIPLSALALPFSPSELLAVARRFADTYRGAYRPRVRSTGPRAARRRLKVGYVSYDFRTHPIAHLMTELWERHDRTRFDVHAYSTGPDEDSALRRRIERAFEHFVDVGTESAERTVQRIRSDGIDILIDLTGYTSGSRVEIFAAGAAPLQMQWLGFLGTQGAEWFDYIVTDRFATPPEAQPVLHRALLYLDCYTPSDTRRSVDPHMPPRAELGLPEDAFVFCCFNNAYKILPPVFAAWMRILAAVPHAVLWLAPSSDATYANLRREARDRGVAPERLIFAPRVDLGAYLARLRRANLFLDTWPYNAGTTANDALFVGLPLLTCAGETLASRVAASQLHAMDAAELVTDDLAAYERKAIELARAPDELARLRAKLDARRATSILFDMERYTRRFEDALEDAWRDYERGSASAAS
jgi:predicted O-linked N-acetylglucosamine transferase (SPINDLY family)